ncbi:hypothetical protein FRB99_004277 [Tulasnella sp. 403]|nr:hypothetical protein FRB99_004277 [Tulasnella sp. 403]
MSGTLDDDYVRRTALWIRTNESGLAGVRAPRPNAMNPLSWMNSAPQKPVILSLTKSQLSYLLTRIEGVGIGVGCLDIKLENPRLAQLAAKDTSDTGSIASFVSHLSLSPSAWWSKPAPIEAELKYIYSALTKLPALILTNPPSHEPEKNAIPLDAFKNLQTLELQDIEPRSLLGWDRLADSLRSLTVKRSGIEDVTHLIVDAVGDDEARRKNEDLAPIRRKSPTRPSLQQRSRHASWQSSLRRTAAIPEEGEGEITSPVISVSSGSASPPLPKLSPSKWGFLRHLCLADNGLTFFPTEVIPYLTTLTHLDLSNNLLVSVPFGLSELHRLTSLNLSGNMIESVLGIYTMLGQVFTLNLGSNRIESLCGLERLGGLQRIDLRNNNIEESAEVGRLATLPNISEVWVGGNPLATREEEWRVNCFSHFAKERKTVLIDGTQPGFFEKGRIDTIVGTPKTEPVTVIASPKPLSAHSRTQSGVTLSVSPRVNGVSNPQNGSSHPQGISEASSSRTVPGHTHPKSKRRKQPRIIDLDESESPSTSRDRSPAPQAILGKSLGQKMVLSASPGKDVHLSSSPPNGLPSSLPKSSFLPPAPPSSDPPKPNQTGQTKSATLGRSKGRSITMGAGVDNLNDEDIIGELPISAFALPIAATNGRGRRIPSASATMSPSMGPASKGSKRRARVSASVYEPGPTLSSSPSTSSSPKQHGIVQPTNGDSSEMQFASEADAFRAKIEALRSEVGDSWLKVLSQSNTLASTPGLS